MESPSEEFVRLVVTPLQAGCFTQQVREQFTPLVKAAFREIIRDAVQARLSSALADSEDLTLVSQPSVEPGEDEVVTTDEEREGFMIVRAIVRDTLKADRVVMRDQKSYCSILVDNNNRKPLARLHFNRSVKYVGLFDGDKEDRVRIDSLDHIYDLTARGARLDGGNDAFA